MDKREAIALIDRMLRSSEGGDQGYDPIGDLASREELLALRELVQNEPPVNDESKA